MADYDIGVQSVVYRDFELSDLLSDVEDTAVSHLELWGHHLSPETDDLERQRGMEALAASDVSICGYGVVDLTAPEEVRAHVDFADLIGADYVTVNYPPEADAITEALIDAAETYDVDVGIHNYSSVHHDDLSKVFSTIGDVRGVLERYDHPRLGLCVDTGHFLVEDVDPETVVQEFGDRINSLHLKDTSDEEIEDVPGHGRLDVATFVGLLDEYADVDAPLVIEYELPQDQASEALREAVANVQAALE